jgi:hypothetical protein
VFGKTQRTVVGPESREKVGTTRRVDDGLTGEENVTDVVVTAQTFR